MIAMNVPKHFLKKDFLIDTVIFDALFSVVFLAVYRPFSNTCWLGVTPVGTFLHSAAFYLCSIAVLLFSKWIFYRFEGKHQPTNIHLVIWVLCECLVIAALYLLFSDISGQLGGMALARLLPKITICVALILVIPLSLCYLYVMVLGAREEIRVLKLNGRGASDSGRMISFQDHSGALKINVSPDDIYYVESQDNYVNIWYMGGEKLTSYLLRNSTAQIEDILKETDIVRCHRSYLVNISKVKVLKHGKGRATIILDDPKGTAIPVSRKYYQAISDMVVPDKQFGK